MCAQRRTIIMKYRTTSTASWGEPIITHKTNRNRLIKTSALMAVLFLEVIFNISQMTAVGAEGIKLKFVYEAGSNWLC